MLRCPHPKHIRGLKSGSPYPVRSSPPSILAHTSSAPLYRYAMLQVASPGRSTSPNSPICATFSQRRRERLGAQANEAR
ncbi:hypothetical protein BU25DRAFT_268177 [Macroventuria anomochaeta]|uniref:Uncharacterized protein n=1 Tax=Macroventuria anomochaeta TaxID=301207 RepID=A0ACB6S638_9PLEO|nr:uncharacterized protein BU25DRAFT_268177 [Macroventuria anomochaeta]KAF2629508.1 hypothetical protein BU25DRAFT_268177 [Macroventuria anomochaeta]